jgi:peptidoglycan biosynthesis protein MviN/MurJ (putative lipid II flippase)
MDAAMGLMAAAGIAIFRPPLWVPLTALAACFGAFGLWGILDRELDDSGARSRRAIGIVRGLVAAAGFLAAIVFGITLFFAALGPIIS